MINRIVLAKFHAEYATAEGRDQAVSHTQELFSKLTDVHAFSVGTPADEHSAAAWDLCLQVQFQDQERLAAYAVDPDHRQYVETFLSPRAVVKKAWNFNT